MELALSRDLVYNKGLSPSHDYRVWIVCCSGKAYWKHFVNSSVVLCILEFPPDASFSIRIKTLEKLFAPHFQTVWTFSKMY